MEEATEDAPDLEACQMIWGTKTREFLAVLQSTVNRAEMGDQEWRLLRYILDLPDLHPYCD